MNPLFEKEPYKSFFDFCKSDDTRTAYGSDFLQFRKLMGKDIAEATRQDLSDFIHKKREAGAKDRSLGRYMAGITKFYHWQIAKQVREDDPSTIFKLETIKPMMQNPKALTKPQREQLLAALRTNPTREHQIAMFVQIGLKTGLRLSEIGRLKWADIDLKNCKLKVVGKGDKPATLNIPGPLKEALMVYKKDVPPSEWVMCNLENPETHYQKSTMAKWCKMLKKRIGWGLEIKFTPHVLRHVFVTTLVEANVKPEVGIKMSRHSDVKTYLGYAKIEEEEVAAENKRALG